MYTSRLQGNGAVIELSLTTSTDTSTSSHLTITSSSFTNVTCSSGFGGAIYYSGSFDSTSFSLSSLTFTSCADSLGTNHSLFINTTSFASFLSYKNWLSVLNNPSSYSENLDSFYTGNCTEVSNFPIIQICFKLSTDLLISPSGIDFNSCGWPALPCKTLAYVHSNRTSPSLFLSDGTHSLPDTPLVISSDSTPSSASLSITAYAPTETSSSPFTSMSLAVLTFSSDYSSFIAYPLFSVSNASFSLSSFSISLSLPFASSPATSTPFFLSAGATLKLTNIQIYGISSTQLQTQLPYSLITVNLTNSSSSLTISVSHSSFSNFSTQSEIIRTASYSSLLSSFCAVSSVSFTDCLFSNITRQTGNGSVFSFSTLIPSITLSNIPASSCCSLDGYGAILYISEPLLSDSAHYHISSLTFVECRSTSDSGLYALADSLSSFLPSSGSASWVSTLFADTSSYDEALLDQFIGAVNLNDSSTTSTYTFSLLHIVFPPASGYPSISSIFVTVPVYPILTDYSTCGWSDLPCLHIYNALQNAGSISVINLTSGSHLAEESALSPPSLTIAGGPIESVPSTTKIVNPILSPLIIVSANSVLSLERISFNSSTDTSSTPLSSSLIQVTNGKLVFTGVGFAHFLLADSSLITTTPSFSTVEFNSATTQSTSSSSSTYKCTFDCIHRQNGAGSVFDFSLTNESSSLSLNNAHFTNFTSSSVSSAIYLVVESIPTQLSFQNLSYASSTDTSLSSASHLLYILSSTDSFAFLPPSTNITSFVGTIDAYSSSSSSLFWVCETQFGRTPPLNTSILYFLFSPSDDNRTEMCVASYGLDHITCGWHSLPCQTISSALNHSDTQDISFLSKSYTLENVTLNLELPALIFAPHSSLTENVVVTVTHTSQTTFTISTCQVTFSGFSFNITSQFPSGIHLITVASSQGSCILINMTISAILSSFTTTDTPLFNITRTQLSTSNTSFSSITRQAGNGTVFEFASSNIQSDSVLSNISFLHCNCVSGNGGGAFIFLSSSSLITLSDITFTDCSATLGGGLFIEAETLSDKTIQFESLTFTNCTSEQGNSSFCLSSTASQFASYPLEQWKNLIHSESYIPEDDIVFVGLCNSSSSPYFFPFFFIISFFFFSFFFFSSSSFSYSLPFSYNLEESGRVSSASHLHSC